MGIKSRCTCWRNKTAIKGIGSEELKYAIFGDIHSSIEDLDQVLEHIEHISPEAKLIGTGDLFECTISKKDITDKKFTELNQVMLNPDGFETRLTFPSVKGNQEERIIQITETNNPLREKLVELPGTIMIENAQVIHGHQWKWGGEPWSLIAAEVNDPLVFYGHSHTSILTIDGNQQKIVWDHPYDVNGEQVMVNVGAVVGEREWVLYEADKKTVTFYKA
ncbi:metallophosphoesterase [Sporosarcina pasteurii]|nr:metallophosphoesterase [Sporosarcina pasteurii]